MHDGVLNTRSLQEFHIWKPTSFQHLFIQEQSHHPLFFCQVLILSAAWCQQQFLGFSTKDQGLFSESLWNTCGNVHSILGLLSTQSPKRNRWLLSTQSWVLNKFKFWVVIECSISEYFLIHHWVHNIFKFWVSIEHSIAQFFH